MNCGLTSVTFRDKSAAEVVALALSNGLTQIEWGADVHVPAGDEATARAVKTLCDDNGIKIPSYGSYYKGSSIEDFMPVLKCATILDAEIIRIWAGRIAPDLITNEQFETLVEALQSACDLAQDVGIDLALEYHRKSMTQTKEGTLRLIRAVNRSNLKCYWQPNPEVSFEEHLAEIRSIGSMLTTMHVFNWGPDNTRFLLDEHEGIDRWRAYAAQARLVGADPNFLIEFVKDDSIESFEADASSLKTIAQKPLALLMGKPIEIERVYASSVLDQIRTLYNLPDLVITAENWNDHLSLLQEALVIFSTWGMLKIDEEAIQSALPKLKAVFYAAGSIHGFARSFVDQGIKIFSAAEANAIPVAQWVSAQIYLANKGFFQHSTAKTRLDFDRDRSDANAFPGNKNVKVGLLGAGSVGRKVIERLKDSEIEMYVYDPYVDEATLESLGAHKADLDTIFRTCQTISNHIPDLPSTKGMLNQSLFELMLPNAVFLNTGRGATVNEADLIRILREKPEMMAILDVTYPEPPKEDSELYTLPNVILTPHLAGSLGQEVIRLAETMANEAQRFLMMDETSTLVDPKSLAIKA